MEKLELLDFSKNNKYLICQDIAGRRYVLDLSDPKIERIQTLGLDYDIDI